ncbi:MAG TPA: outer membrane beta-barrel protein [Chitinophagaceae bacterium]|nr:outer membrane beta-barrel protein [Chitinophagaceae bacterium]
MIRYLFRNLFLSLILTLGFFRLDAQQIGIHGGLSLPDLRGATQQQQTVLSRQDGYYGFFLSFRLKNLLSIQADLNYCGEGGISSGIQQVFGDNLKAFPPSDTLYANYESHTILHYLEVPVVARITWGNQVRYFLEGGIFTGYLVDARQVNNGGGGLYKDPGGKIPAVLKPGETPFSPAVLNSNSNIYNRINTVNFGLTGGGGMSYKIGRNEIYLELRISEGMQGIYRDQAQFGKYKTGNVTVSFGYAFLLTK